MSDITEFAIVIASAAILTAIWSVVLPIVMLLVVNVAAFGAAAISAVKKFCRKS